jgi:hypothetical protein
MRRPSGAHIRKNRCVGKEKLTKASVGIFVDEGSATGYYYRGTIATRNRIRGIIRSIRVAAARAVTTGRIAATIGLSVLALVSKGHREGNCEGNRHKSTGSNSQPYGTAIEGSGLGYRLR